MSTNLIMRLRDGEESSFKDIYELYHFKVFSFVKKYTSQISDAEDVTQNVFIHIWNYRNRLDPGTELEAILFKSSKQEISKWYKKQNRVFSLEESRLVRELDHADAEEEEQLRTKLEKINLLLEQMPARRRRIFKLYKFEEWSYSEIASEMQMSPSAVANQVSKTLQYLKKNSVKRHELYWFAFVFLDSI